MKIPSFRYHPNPLETEAVRRRSVLCQCCERQVDHVYEGPVYGDFDDEPELCPWCIADGSAQEKLGAFFNDTPNSGAVPEEAIAEIVERTPGYTAWQQPEWMFHCDDGCAFLGDATPATVENMKDTALQEMLDEAGVDADDWDDIVESYEPCSEPSIYHFRCLHCGVDRFRLDMG